MVKRQYTLHYLLYNVKYFLLDLSSFHIGCSSNQNSARGFDQLLGQISVPRTKLEILILAYPSSWNASQNIVILSNKTKSKKCSRNHLFDTT